MASRSPIPTRSATRSPRRHRERKSRLLLSATGMNARCVQHSGNSRHRQNAHATKNKFSRKGGKILFRQVNGECTSLAELRGHSHFATVQQREVFHDRKSEAGAAHVSRARPVDTIEAFEESLEMLPRNSVAV